MKAVTRYTLVVALALWAVILLLVLAADGKAAAWQFCPRSELPGMLKVKVAGCPEGRAVITRFAEKAQYRGPRIRVFGFRCSAEGASPIRCWRGAKRIEYIGAF